jgi:predicted DNA-binding transcriptional regulator AlpA
MSVENKAKITLPDTNQHLLQTERLVRDAEGAAILGCSKATFWRLVAKGAIPPPIKIGGMSRWKVSDVQAFIEQAAQNRI